MGQFRQLRPIVVLISLQIALQKERMVVVQRFHVGPDPFPGFLVGQRFAGKMMILEQLLNEDGGGLVAGVRLGDGRLAKINETEPSQDEDHPRCP